MHLSASSIFHVSLETNSQHIGTIPFSENCSRHCLHCIAGCLPLSFANTHSTSPIRPENRSGSGGCSPSHSDTTTSTAFSKHLAEVVKMARGCPMKVVTSIRMGYNRCSKPYVHRWNWRVLLRKTALHSHSRLPGALYCPLSSKNSRVCVRTTQQVQV